MKQYAVYAVSVVPLRRTPVQPSVLLVDTTKRRSIPFKALLVRMFDPSLGPYRKVHLCARYRKERWV